MSTDVTENPDIYWADKGSRVENPLASSDCRKAGSRQLGTLESSGGTLPILDGGRDGAGDRVPSLLSPMVIVATAQGAGQMRSVTVLGRAQPESCRQAEPAVGPTGSKRVIMPSPSGVLQRTNPRETRRSGQSSIEQGWLPRRSDFCGVPGGTNDPFC